MIKYIKDVIKKLFKEEKKYDSFSEFFTESSSKERVKVLRNSARLANEDQKLIIEHYKTRFRHL